MTPNTVVPNYNITLYARWGMIWHSLGFFGHSLDIQANRLDVMHANAWHASALRPAEVRHLRQIYDRFR